MSSRGSCLHWSTCSFEYLFILIPSRSLSQQLFHLDIFIVFPQHVKKECQDERQLFGIINCRVGFCFLSSGCKFKIRSVIINIQTMSEMLPVLRIPTTECNGVYLQWLFCYFHVAYRETSRDTEML